MSKDTPPGRDRPEPPQRGGGAVDWDTYPERSQRNQLLDLPNVNGHAIGFRYKDGEMTDEVVVQVTVDEKVPEEALDDEELVPKDFDGVPTDVVEATVEPHLATGVDEPQATVKGGRNGYQNPTPAGVQIEMYNPDGSTARGSHGGWFEYDSGHRALSALHIPAGDEFEGDYTGETVYHAGTEIATLTEYSTPGWAGFCDVFFATSNLANDPPNDRVSRRILGLGIIEGITSPVLGMRSTHTGWRTGIVGGRITAIDGTAYYMNTIIHGLYTANVAGGGGNSGSMSGWLAPNGDMLGLGIHVAGRSYEDQPTESLIASFDTIANSRGLGPLEAPEDVDETIPWGHGDRYIEGAIQDIRHYAGRGELEIDVYLTNTGGQDGNVNATIYAPDTSPIDSRTVQRDVMEQGMVTFTIDDTHHGDRLIFATTDMINAYSEDPGISPNQFWFGFDAVEPHHPSWSGTQIDTTVNVESTPNASATARRAATTIGEQTLVMADEATATVDTPSPGKPIPAEIVLDEPAEVWAGAPVAGVSGAVVVPEPPDYHFEDPIAAPPYGGVGYGEGAYGADYNPWVSDRGWDLPVRGDPPEVYHEKVATVADNIDYHVVRKGPREERPPPGLYDSATEGAYGQSYGSYYGGHAPEESLAPPHRLYLVTDDDDGETNRLYHDRGDEWESVDLEIAINEEALTDGDVSERITGAWEFLRRIDADITGSATGVKYADEVESTYDTEALGGVSGENFAPRSTDDVEDVEGQWSFAERVRMANTRSQLTGGAITLPSYEQSDER